MGGELERAITLAMYLGVGLVALSLVVSAIFVWRVWLPAWMAVRLLAEPPIVQRRRSWHRGEGFRPSTPTGPPSASTSKPPSNR